MVPSVSCDLAHVRATLQRLATEESLDATVRSDLQAAEHVVALVDRAWARMPSYLAEDNLRLRGVLAELAELVPSALVDGATPDGSHSGRCDEVHDLDERNRALRSALSRVITAVSSTDTETVSRVQRLCAGALRAGVASRPW